MTLHQFKIWATAAKLGSLSKAAAELRISQPSVTRQLKMLEDEISTVLYINHGRGISITEKGGVFLRDIKPVLSGFELIRAKYEPQRGGRPT